MKKVIIFGKGRYFNKKFVQGRYEIIAFLDNAVADRDYSNEFGCDIYNPGRWKCLPEYPIICMSVHFVEMWKQMVELGIPTARIFFAVSLSPFYYEYEKIMFSHGERIEAKNDELIYYDSDNQIYPFKTENEFYEIVRRKMQIKCPEINLFSEFKNNPISRTFGGERGKPVDRVYIEYFLQQNCIDIHGTVMEIESDDYIKRFGGDRVLKKIILHVKGWGGKNVIKGNFETGEGLYEHMVDCLICTQTLQYIYDLKKALHNIYKILKPDGVALITVPGIKPLSQFHEENWGEYWSFTKKSVKNLCVHEFGEEHVEVKTYGNVKTSAAFLYGLCKEDLKETDFDYNDEQFPFLITARVVKK